MAFGIWWLGRRSRAQGLQAGTWSVHPGIPQARPPPSPCLLPQIQPRDMDTRALGGLAAVHPRSALEALSRLQSAVRERHIRNPAAYLAGVLSNLPWESSRDAASGGGRLAPVASLLLDQAGLLRGPRALDTACLDGLAVLPPETQFLICDEFVRKRLDDVRSMPGCRGGLRGRMHGWRGLGEGGGGLVP